MRKRQTPYDITYMQNPEYDSKNDPIYETERDSQSEQTYGARGREGGKDWEPGLQMQAPVKFRIGK